MKIYYSAIQPTANLHLGNYLGAVRTWTRLQQCTANQSGGRCVFALADLHALTSNNHQTAKSNEKTPEIGANSLEMARMLLACGVAKPGTLFSDTILYAQSHVREHTELAWILNCLANVGQLFRMTQWKDKVAQSQTKADTSSLGLLAYPVLQAADILLFKATHVPVGQDQVQHLELCRDLALLYRRRYNASGKNTPATFPLPEAVLSPSPKIMSLRQPGKKMSKSDRSEQGIIWLTDNEDDIRRKIKRAVTDSTEDTMTQALWDALAKDHGRIDERGLADQHRPFAELENLDQKTRAGVQNLWAISAACLDRSLADTYKEFCRQFDGESRLTMSSLKDFTARNIIDTLKPIQKEYRDLKEDDEVTVRVLKYGAGMASYMAAETMKQVRRDVGLLAV